MGLLSYAVGICVMIWICGELSSASCTYEMTPQHALPGPTIKLIKAGEDGLSRLDTCKRWCDRTDTCLSLDYNNKYGLCYLSHLNRDTDTTDSFKPSTNVDPYEKGWCSDEPNPSLPVYSEECRAGWQYYNGSCYYVQYNYKYDWHMSQSLCEDMGAHLATVHSADELHFVGEAIDRVDFEGESGHAGKYWVGARREESIKPFIWTDGTILPEESPLWQSNQPGYYFEDAVGIKADWDLGESKEDGSLDITWAANGLFTEKGTDFMTFICEYKVANDDEEEESSWWSWLTSWLG